MSYQNLITVNYKGGFGGDFFALLLGSALHNEQLNVAPDSNNKYIFKNNTSDLSNKYNFYMPRSPRRVFAYQKYPEFRDVVNQLNNKATKNDVDSSFLNDYRFYLSAKNNDDVIVKQNIINVYREFITPPNNLEVANFHNTKFYEPGLSLQDIFPLSKNIQLSATEYKYYVIFSFLLWYKFYTSSNNIDSNVNSFVSQIIDDRHEENELLIMMDKLLFDINYSSYESQLDESLSQLIGQEIVLDKDKLHEYRMGNINIIKNFFNVSEEDILSDETIELIRSHMVTVNG